VTTTKTSVHQVTTTHPVTTTKAPTTNQPKPTDKPFDINYWVQYAKDYAVSSGYELDKGTMGTWDTPLSAGPTVKSTERGIKSYLDSYKREGYTAMWVWAELQPGSTTKYHLYISRG
jgi:hypothetical protein